MVALLHSAPLTCLPIGRKGFGIISCLKSICVVRMDPLDIIIYHNKCFVKGKKGGGVMDCRKQVSYLSAPAKAGWTISRCVLCDIAGQFLISKFNINVHLIPRI